MLIAGAAFLVDEPRVGSTTTSTAATSKTAIGVGAEEEGARVDRDAATAELGTVGQLKELGVKLERGYISSILVIWFK